MRKRELGNIFIAYKNIIFSNDLVYSHHKYKLLFMMILLGYPAKLNCVKIMQTYQKTSH